MSKKKGQTVVSDIVSELKTLKENAKNGSSKWELGMGSFGEAIFNVANYEEDDCVADGMLVTDATYIVYLHNNLDNILSEIASKPKEKKPEFTVSQVEYLRNTAINAIDCSNFCYLTSVIAENKLRIPMFYKKDLKQNATLQIAVVKAKKKTTYMVHVYPHVPDDSIQSECDELASEISKALNG